MKKILLFVLVFTVSVAVPAQISIGGGVSMGPEISVDDDGSDKLGFGVNVRADFSLLNKIAFTPGFNYFMPSTPDGLDLSIWQINADLHYTLIGSPGPVRLYGLAGVNFTSARAELDSGISFDETLDQFGDFFGDAYEAGADESDNDLGLNIGGGLAFSKLYGEAKYDTSLEQVIFSVGILF